MISSIHWKTICTWFLWKVVSAITLLPPLLLLYANHVVYCSYCIWINLCHVLRAKIWNVVTNFEWLHKTSIIHKLIRHWCSSHFSPFKCMQPFLNSWSHWWIVKLIVCIWSLESFINPTCFLVASGQLQVDPPDDWQEVIEREANAK